MPQRDWGADTFARFRYQAEVTLPYCLAALTSTQDILVVIPEHLEDIALKTKTGYRFLQVKTRDPERGLWTASALFAKGSGALRSLYRTYLLTKSEPHSLELILEGAVKNNDPIRTLYPGQDRTALLSIVMEKLGSSQIEAEAFLARLTLNESAPNRRDIHATNARLLHQLAPPLTYPELEALHVTLLGEIESAMRCTRLNPLWPRSVVHPDRRSSVTDERIRAKTLDANRLSVVVGVLSQSGHPLLKRFVEPSSRPVTPLVQKLMGGGAPDALIEIARNLQANARYQHSVRTSQTLTDDDATVADLRERLLTFAQTAGALHTGSQRPAVTMWDYLLDRFSAHADNIDTRNLLRRDPMLLMGETCILSDECAFDWGAAAHARQ